MSLILVLNTGASSIKFAAYDQSPQENDLRLIGRGHVVTVNGELELQISTDEDKLVEECRWKPGKTKFDHDDALAHMFTWLADHHEGQVLTAIGHRVVHGGAKYLEPVWITTEVLMDLDVLVPLAPLHQPFNLKAIRILAERWPAVPQLACFDTSFHHTQPFVAQAFALPREITVAGVKRFGFHGISCEYIATQLPRVLSEKGNGKVIVAHLGCGASLCAMIDGKSMASTTGFTALDGLMMGTRSGSIDPGVVLYMLQQLHMSATEVSDTLYQHSGLLGVSGISSDLRILLKSADPCARDAIDLFVYRIVCEIGSLTAAMGGLDALVFTAGIGENSALIRTRVVEGCAWLGAQIEETANRIDLELIHSTESKICIAVIPTNEEYMVAYLTQKKATEASVVERETAS